jgi:hypothetical protein
MKMKRACILLLVTLGLATTVCLGQSAPTNQPDAPRIKPPTAAREAPPSPASAPPARLEDELIAREKEVWEAIKKKDQARFASYLAEDQLYVSNDGVFTKAEAVKQLSAATMPPDIRLGDWKVLMIDKDAAIVTYTATAVTPACGPATAGGVQRNTTVWAKRSGKWLAILHQDTNAASGK